jgi:hypothetical protein
MNRPKRRQKGNHGVQYHFHKILLLFQSVELSPYTFLIFLLPLIYYLRQNSTDGLFIRGHSSKVTLIVLSYFRIGLQWIHLIVLQAAVIICRNVIAQSLVQIEV